MKTYKALVEGINCWASFDGTTRRLGFFTTRVVSAINETQAKQVILRELTEELQPRLLNDPLAPPEISVKEVIEADPSVANTIANSGFTWYCEDIPQSN